MELDLWLGHQLVARTVTTNRKVRIVYDDAVVAEFGGEVPLLSCSLPTPGPSGPAAARAFLEGLLPEGRALTAAAAQVRGVRLGHDGAPETPADAIALLAEYGRECAGAVIAAPAGEPPPGEGQYAPLDGADLAGLIEQLPLRPLGTDPRRGIRMSLAGAQDKLLLALIDGRWHQPVGGAPSTHILKPTTTWPDSARNEALVAHLARVAGLTGTVSWVEQIGGTAVLVVERYDRRVVNGTVRRVHQEDMCQALGIRPGDKYAIGRPSGRMAKLLREVCASPGTEIERLFRQVAFRAVVGDEDSHGKNFSLLLDDGQVTLAPIYDSLCTLAYPELGGRMAAPIGAQTSLGKVDRHALRAEARAMGVTDSRAEACLDRLAADVRRGLDELPRGLVEGWDADRVIDLVSARVDRLENGQPLGGDVWRSASPAHSLDRATVVKRASGQPSAS